MNNKPETGNQVVITSLFTILLLLLAPSVALPGVINTKIDLSCAVDKKNDIAVHAKITNKGNSTAYKVTLSLFMEDWAQKFDSLGDNPPEGTIKFKENISIPELKPGRHTLVARVSFEEQNGTSHRLYAYFPFSYKIDRIRKEQQELSLELKPPVFNTRAFWEKKKEIIIHLNNPHDYPVSSQVSFFLPDGYTAEESTVSTEISPNKNITENVAVEKDKSINQGGKILAVAWYEKDGIIYSVKSEGMAGVEEKPVLLKWYVLFSIIILIAVTIFRAVRRKS